MVTVCCTGPGAHDWLIEIFFLNTDVLLCLG
jgi:hypothetical protein